MQLNIYGIIMEGCFIKLMNDKYVNEITWLFNQYEITKLRYCILRKYRSLPLLEGKDIDIIIAKEDRHKNIQIINEMIKKFNLKLKKKILMPYARRFYFKKNEDNENNGKYLILDYHFDEEWMGVIFLEFDDIPKKKYKNFVVAYEYLEPLLPFITYLLSTKDVLEKYFQQLVEYTHLYHEEMKKMIFIIMGKELGEYFFDQVYNSNKDNIKKIANKIRTYILLKSLKKYPLGTIKRFFETIIKIIWYKKILKVYPP